MKSIFDENPKRKKEDSSNYKHCQYCGTTMPITVKYPYCDSCRDILLFQEVKDFIRENNVNEFQVAERFGLPLRTVKGWIKDGRIEYKETVAGAKALNNKLRCERCGAPVTFGTVCPKCLKLMNNNVKGYGMQQTAQGDDRMFFLDENNKRGPQK